ncbi:MAG: hypothetical protein H7143_10305 [Pseudorhodobacter sp.]|nr:hypothetical protein [Rhizobacter sp.]
MKLRITASRYGLPLLLFAGLSFSLNEPSSAQTQKAKEAVKERSFGKGKATGPLLTRAQLRECMAQQDRMRVMTEEAVTLQTQFIAEKADLTQQGVVLKEELALLERTNAQAVEQYNAKAAARDKAIDVFEAGTDAYNKRVKRLTMEREIFVSGCENRRFDERDEIAIQQGK